jgi:hypothetical protein
MLRRIVRRGLCLSAILTLLCAGVTLAAGRETVTETTREHNVVLLSEEGSENPCTHETGTLTAVAANSVFHATFFANSDEFWVTGTSEGTATFTPDAVGGESASGHFAVWFGAAGNNKNEVETNTITFVLSGSNGSHTVVHATGHVSTDANGGVKVQFEKMSAHCA